METTRFTFLNTTGAPRLSKPAAKKVRGHVTRTNFANRRRRKAEAKSDETGTKFIRQRVTRSLTDAPCAEPNHDAWDALADALSAAASNSDQYQSAKLRTHTSSHPRSRKSSDPGQSLTPTVSEFWAILFLDSRGIPGDSEDREWLQLLASEPALVEASLSMAVRCWSTKANCHMRAEFHACRATSLLIQRIGSSDAYTDGFLGAAFTMALNERLLRNDKAWEVHMGGIIEAVRARRTLGLRGLPQLFVDLVILDTANAIIDFPRVYHPILARDIGDHGCNIISVLNDTAARVSHLRRMIESHRSHPLDEERIALVIQEPHDLLVVEIGALLEHESAYVRSTAKAIELIISLSWPLETDHARSAILATELKNTLTALHGRTCLYMDVSSCPIIIGAIASAQGSEARLWFVDKLQRAIRVLQDRGWSRPFEILEGAMARDERLAVRLRALRDEEFAALG